MVYMIDPNIDRDKLSDELLIQEFKNPSVYKVRHLYDVMAKRSSDNEEIKQLLFKLILSEDARKEKEMGFIMHAWLPAISILKEGKDEVKQELPNILRQWTTKEKELFLNYVKGDQEYYCLLYDIVS